MLLAKLQAKLGFEGCRGLHFRSAGSLGRVALTASLLGFFLAVHLTIAVFLLVAVMTENTTSLGLTEAWCWSILQWCIYASLLCGFHLSEFFATAVNEDRNLSNDSFVVNHSVPYTIAALASWIEFWSETVLLHIYGSSLEPTWWWSWIIALKQNIAFCTIGFILVVGGWMTRYYAMTYCGRNFSHQIMLEHDRAHRLVTTGIYSVLRHPSYFGWFYWSIGTQILLCNPICIVFYTLASWQFFSGRIPFEEATLCDFYPNEYEEYMKKTYIGIPFIRPFIGFRSAARPARRPPGQQQSSAQDHTD